jgi:hypothetical protein
LLKQSCIDFSEKGLFTANMTVAAAVDILLAVGLCAVLWRTYREVVSGVAGLKS